MAAIRPSGVFDSDYGQDIALNRTLTDKLISNGLALLLLLIPVLVAGEILPARIVGTINRIAILVIAVQGLNILVGYTGQISLGHAAFVAVGAYSAANFMRGVSTIDGGLVTGIVEGGSTIIPAMPFWLAVPLAALFTGLIGLFFGLPSLRVKGFYLAMATLAAQFIIPWVMKNPLEGVTNGGVRALEAPAPNVLGNSFTGQAEVYYIIIPVAILMMLAARNIIRTRVGRAFISVRDNDLAAELLGINVFVYKLQAFFLSALYAGVAGALIAIQNDTVSLEPFNLDYSIQLLAMLIIGGAGFPLGALFGAAFYVLLTQNVVPAIIPELKEGLPELLPFMDATSIEAGLTPFLFGLALVLFLIFEPRGIAHRWEILKISWKIRPYSY
jgi:branched-chain amino acid transport system permease protein